MKKKILILIILCMLIITGLMSIPSMGMNITEKKQSNDIILSGNADTVYGLVYKNFKPEVGVKVGLGFGLGVPIIATTTTNSYGYYCFKWCSESYYWICA